MKAQELREKTPVELADYEKQLLDELFKLRMKHYSGQLQKNSELRRVRREIARVKTIMTEKQSS